MTWLDLAVLALAIGAALRIILFVLEVTNTDDSSDTQGR